MDAAKPAELLEGALLADGWRVTQRLDRGADATGGTFSVPYLAERIVGATAEHAFCKALDFSNAPRMAAEAGCSVIDAFKSLTDAYVFERDLVLHCAGRRMTNVIRALTAGEFTITEHNFDPIYATVPYIIFERADGDVRGKMASSAFDDAVKLRVLHGAANGLRQLHGAQVFHQDLKPSNVMLIGGSGKLGDLGRAMRSDSRGIWDDLLIAGDRTYAPPELLYGGDLADPTTRRLACDAYHLGSLAMFLFTGSSLTPLVFAELPDEFHWRTWPRDFRNALPYLRDAFGRVLDAEAGALSPTLGVDLLPVVRELGDPDPLVRGVPRGTGRSRYSMQRYVSIFDRLARRAEMVARGNMR
ncbi:MAG: hypothetical protein R2743_02155 [Ilumatobacteraceae bacterium]